LVAAAALAGCGGGASEEARVRGALDDLVTAIRAENAVGFCGKAFPSVFLPPHLARQIGVPEGQPGTPSAWDRAKRECVANARREGFSGGFRRVPRLTIKAVRLGGPVTNAGGISRTASATAELTQRGKRARHTFQLVRYQGDWKVVLVTD
jgi:hypothetical protein